MKKIPLHLSIPNPCMENYAAMEKKEFGSYCNKCESIIYDFSELTDIALIEFFKKFPETHCGRFHVSQLNRDIKKVGFKNILFYKFSKIAASFFALLAFKFSNLKASNKIIPNITWHDKKYNTKEYNKTDSTIIISGIVKDNYGKPLSKASIVFNGNEMATTNEKGEYRFEIKEPLETNLFIHFTGLISAVRNYHPSMGSTNYNIVLAKPTEEGHGHTMGIMMPPSRIGDIPSIKFENNKTLKLSKEIKNIISLISLELKSNPTANILIQGFSNKFTSVLINARVEKIKKHFIEIKGISEDRIATDVEISTFKNEIEIKAN